MPAPIHIPEYLDRDALLLYSVHELNRTMKADGCSIFLKTPGTEKYVLRESTVLTEFVGVSTIDFFNRQRALNANGLFRIGLTFLAINGGSHVVGDVRKDESWEGYKLPKGTHPNFHCELPPDAIRAFVGIRLDYGVKAIGLLRLVSRKPSHFTPSRVEQLKGFANTLADRLETSISLSELMDTGASLTIEDLCQSVVEDLKRLTRAKGCTILVRDQDEGFQGPARYYAIASTGVFDQAGNRYSREDQNLREVVYQIGRDEFYSTSLTEYAIKNKTQIIIDDVYCDNQLGFYRDRGLRRQSGHGKYSEYHLAENQQSHTGAILYSPLFDRDTDEVMGLIRLNKERVLDTQDRNSNTFSKYERQIFKSYVDKLPPVLGNIAYVSAIEEIHRCATREKLYDIVVSAAPGIVGGRGCSLLILNAYSNRLEFKASYGYLRNRLEHLAPYEIGVGYTGWVAQHREFMMFNDKSELEGPRYRDRRPIHSERFEECETGDYTSEKFLAVPVLTPAKELAGVLRVPKRQGDSNFTQQNVKLLTSLAEHAGLALERIESYGKSLSERNVFGVCELGISLFEQPSLHAWAHVFLTGLTHGEGIGFNRAMLFKYEKDSATLTGIASIGPTDSEQAKELRISLERNRSQLTLSNCAREFERRGKFIEDALFLRVDGVRHVIPARLALREWLERGEMFRALALEERASLFGKDFSDFLADLEVKRTWLFVLSASELTSYMTICDNPYDNKVLDTDTQRLLERYLLLAQKALQRLNLAISSRI